MTTYETRGRMTYKDENGDNHIIYPVTKMDCIDDMPDVEKMIAESVATYMEENPIETPDITDQVNRAEAAATRAEEAAARIPESGGGTVKTVNGVEPDENGNVEIAIPDYGGNVDLTGVVKSVNGKTPDDNGNVEITVSDEETVDGGYYTPSVSQLDANTMSISFTASKDGMPVVAEQNIALPAGKNGDTPVRGTDYWTDADIAEIKSYVDEAILGGAW